MPKVVLQTTLTSTKVCKGCNLNLPISCYYNATPKALATLCKPCHNTKSCLTSKSKTLDFSLRVDDEKKIVVWLPYLKTTMLIKESDFNPEWMEMPLK